MNSMKKKALLMGVMVAAMTLTGCGNNTPASTTSRPVSTSTSKTLPPDVIPEEPFEEGTPFGEELLDSWPTYIKAKVADREDQIAKLKDDLAKMTAERDQLKKQAELLSMPKSEYKDVNAPVEAIEKMEEVKVEITGKILEVNEEWNFITMDLGKDQVVPGLKMAVNQNGSYIATVKITKVEDRVCCAEVVSGRVADIKPGAVVFYSGTNKVGKED